MNGDERARGCIESQEWLEGKAMAMANDGMDGMDDHRMDQQQQGNNRRWPWAAWGSAAPAKAAAGVGAPTRRVDDV